MDYGIKISINANSAINGLANLKKALGECENKTSTLKKAMSQIKGDTLASAASGMSKVAKEAGRASKEVTQLQKAASTAGKVLASAFSLASARKLMKYADAYTEMQNKIRALGGETTDYVATQRELFQVSNRARTDATSMTQLYSRLMLAQKNLGASSEDLMRFTEGIGKAMQISGASAFTQRGVLLQLSQAMGTDIVRAEEFNSVLEGGIRIAQAAADGIDAAGGSVAQLRKLVIDGKISSKEFFEAIMSQLPKLEAEFAKTQSTTAQAFTVLNNNIAQFIGNINESWKISETFNVVINDLANNVDALAGALAVGATVLTAAKILSWVAALKEALGVVNKLKIAFGLLFKNPIFLAIAGLTAAYFALRDSVDETTKAQKREADTLDDLNRLYESQKILSVDVARQKLDEAKAIEKAREKKADEAEARYLNAKAAYEEFKATHSVLKLLSMDGIKLYKDSQSALEAYEKATHDLDDAFLGVAQAENLLKDAEKASAAQKAKIQAAQLSKEEEKRQQRIQDTIAGLKFEEEQLKRTTLQQEIYNNLKKVGLEGATVSETGQVSGLSGTDLQAAQTIADSTIRIIKLNEEIEKAKKKTKTAQEYLKEWADSMLDWGANVSNGFISMFGHAEDAIIDFAKTGKFSFSDFAESVIEDISRIIIRAMIAKAVMAAIGFADGGEAASTSSFKFPSDALGIKTPIEVGTLDPVSKATGGLIRGAGTGTSDSIPARLSNGEFVVNAKSTARYRPMLEAMNANRFAGGGYAGEGSYGSNVNIQVIDQRGANSAPVETKESTGPDGQKMIQMIIRDTVRQGFANGEYDSSMRTIYGIRRAGVKR